MPTGSETPSSGVHAAPSTRTLDPSILDHLTPVLRRFTLPGKVAVITGGAQGLGYSMAHAIAEAGAKGVAILDVNQELGEISALTLKKQTHVDCRFFKVDVTNEHAVHVAVDQIVAHFGSVDILINSAGIADSNIAAETYPSERFRHQLEVNLTGSFLVAKECANRMIAAKHGGSIVFIASMSGTIVNVPQEQCAYNASKAGVLQLMRSLAAEWAEFGIRVNAISPGYMDTPLNNKHGLDKVKSIWRERTPMTRLGEPGELGGAALYLASDASSFMTGANMVIDGGYSVH